MSARDDFYAPRRGEMADTGAYSGFLVGFFGAAPFGWTALTASFEDSGDATMGVIKFVGTLIAAGLVTGVAGYAVGALAGRIWELRHRATNPRVKPEAGPDMATLTAARPEETVAAVARAWQRQAQQAAPVQAAPELTRFDAPNAVREFPRGRIELARTGNGIVGRVTCEPGWRWSRDIGAPLSQERRRNELTGIVLEGAATAVFADGVAHALDRGTHFRLPAIAHDLEVVGDVPFVAIILIGASEFAPTPTGRPS